MDKAEQQDNQNTDSNLLNLSLSFSQHVVQSCVSPTHLIKLHLFIATHEYYDCYIVVCMVIIDVFTCYFYFYFYGWKCTADKS